MRRSLVFVLLAAAAVCQQEAAKDGGFRPLFDGKSLAGWHGQRQFDPVQLAAMDATARAKLLAEDAATVAPHWTVQDGELVNDGHGAFLTTDAEYGDAEFRLEYKTVALADSGIYLRGCPQVQIWDTTEAGGKWNLGADKGSGALWNNEKHERFPPKLADKPFGEWNLLVIRQIGELVWVELNGVVTVDGVVMENYFDRKRPLPAKGPLQLQTHGGEIRFKNLLVREIAPQEANAVLSRRAGDGFTALFDGKGLTGWQGAVDEYEVVDGAVRCKAGKGGVLFTKETYTDYQVQLEFLLPQGGNNGLANRYPGTGDPAYSGFEIQVLDDSAAQYASLKPYQYHGSVYGAVASQRGYQRPVGQWNFEQVTVRGSRVTVELNGTVIVDADLAGLQSQLKDATGLHRTEGHFGFCGHNDPVAFRNILIRRL